MVRREEDPLRQRRSSRKLVRFAAEVDLSWGFELANGFANAPHDTARFTMLCRQDRMDVGKMPNQSTRLIATALANMRILELENRCTGNRTVGRTGAITIRPLFAGEALVGVGGPPGLLFVIGITRSLARLCRFRERASETYQHRTGSSL